MVHSYRHEYFAGRRYGPGRVQPAPSTQWAVSLRRHYRRADIHTLSDRCFTCGHSLCGCGRPLLLGISRPQLFQPALPRLGTRHAAIYCLSPGRPDGYGHISNSPQRAKRLAQKSSAGFHLCFLHAGLVNCQPGTLATRAIDAGLGLCSLLVHLGRRPS